MSTEIKVRFKISTNEFSRPYSIMELLTKGEDDILCDMEVCTCQLTESNNHCECQSQYEDADIIGFEILTKPLEVGEKCESCGKPKPSNAYLKCPACYGDF